jgi:hypothetical protein
LPAMLQQLGTTQLKLARNAEPINRKMPTETVYAQKLPLMTMERFVMFAQMIYPSGMAINVSPALLPPTTTLIRRPAPFALKDWFTSKQPGPVKL